MSHSAILGGVEFPLTYWRDEAIALMQEAGVVGAGGGGFPTYVKYQSPARLLIINACDSEPGYYADKLLLRDEPEALIDVYLWMHDTFSLDETILAAEEVAKPDLKECEKLAQRVDGFRIHYVPSEYKFGEEHALIKEITGQQVPHSDPPSKHGIIVQNNETMFNIYRAVFRKRPVLTKFVNVYGEIGGTKVYEVPIGTLAKDIFEAYGADPADYVGCKLYDGGPVLCECVVEEMDEDPLYAVSRTTNGLLVVHPDKDKPRARYYPDPDYVDNEADAPWAAHRIHDLTHAIRHVRVPIDSPFQTGRIVVAEGDTVTRGDTLQEPSTEGFSVGAHASISGTVKTITNDFIEIMKERR